MSIPVYADVHVPTSVVEGLRARGVDVLTAQEDGQGTTPDEELLRRATSLGRVMLSQDEGMLALANVFQQSRTEFAGLIYAHQLRATIGQMVADVELICLVEDPPYMRSRVEWLPLR